MSPVQRASAQVTPPNHRTSPHNSCGTRVPASLGFGPATGPLVTLFTEHVPTGADHGKHSVIARAVDWLIKFQADGESAQGNNVLNPFSRDFYLGWIEPFCELAKQWSRVLDIPQLDARHAGQLLAEDAERLTIDGLETTATVTSSSATSWLVGSNS